MERKLGEIFTYNGKIYQVVEGITCKGCTFMNNGRHCFSISKLLGLCSDNNRTDKTSIIFKEIKDMEIKNNQLTIDIPKGMEIDLENSDLAKGIIKFRDKWLTLEQIHGSTKEDCYLTNRCGIRDYHNNKLVAIANLMDIARYFNGNWKYRNRGDNCGYMITYDKTRTEEDGYQVVHINSDTDMYFGNIMFKNEADAKYVIDNPNFRNILDAIYKN